MRTIKFRGKAHGHNSAWAYGSLLQDAEGNCMICSPECVIEPLQRVLVDYDTVGQFTGLYDADGNEIYEGDIVMVENTLACEVGWNNSIAAYCLMHHGEMYRGVFPIYSKLIRLIGNIHDNPELLSNSK